MIKKTLQNDRDKIAVAGVTALGLGAVVRSARLRNRYKKFAEELDKLLKGEYTTWRVGGTYFIEKPPHKVEIDLSGKLFQTINKELVLNRDKECLFKGTTVDNEAFREEIARKLYKKDSSFALFWDNDLQFPSLE